MIWINAEHGEQLTFFIIATQGKKITKTQECPRIWEKSERWENIKTGIEKTVDNNWHCIYILKIKIVWQVLCDPSVDVRQTPQTLNLEK